MHDAIIDDGKVKYLLYLHGKKNKLKIKYHLFVSLFFGVLGGLFAGFLAPGYGDSALGFFIGFAIYDAASTVIIARAEDELVKYEYLWPNEHKHAHDWLKKNT